MPSTTGQRSPGAVAEGMRRVRRQRAAGDRRAQAQGHGSPICGEHRSWNGLTGPSCTSRISSSTVAMLMERGAQVLGDLQSRGRSRRRRGRRGLPASRHRAGCGAPPRPSARKGWGSCASAGRWRGRSRRRGDRPSSISPVKPLSGMAALCRWWASAARNTGTGSAPKAGLSSTPKTATAQQCSAWFSGGSRTRRGLSGQVTPARGWRARSSTKAGRHRPRGAALGERRRAAAPRSPSRSPATAAKPRSSTPRAVASSKPRRRRAGSVEVAEARRRQRGGDGAAHDDVDGVAAQQGRPGLTKAALGDRALAAAERMRLRSPSSDKRRRRWAAARPPVRSPLSRGGSEASEPSSQSSSIVSCLWKACSGAWPLATIGALKNRPICSCTPPSPRRSARPRHAGDLDGERRRQDRILAEEVDLDLHPLAHEAGDVDVVPGFLVVAARTVVADVDDVVLDGIAQHLVQHAASWCRAWTSASWDRRGRGRRGCRGCWSRTSRRRAARGGAAPARSPSSSRSGRSCRPCRRRRRCARPRAGSAAGRRRRARA